MNFGVFFPSFCSCVERNECQLRHIIPNIRQSSFTKSQKIQNVCTTEKSFAHRTHKKKGMQRIFWKAKFIQDTIEAKLSDTEEKCREKKHSQPQEAFNGNGLWVHIIWYVQSLHIANTLNNQNKWVEKQIFIPHTISFALAHSRSESVCVCSCFFFLTYIVAYYGMLFFFYIHVLLVYCCYFFFYVFSRHLDFNAFLLRTHDE